MVLTDFLLFFTDCVQAGSVVVENSTGAPWRDVEIFANSTLGLEIAVGLTE